jgi:hypothetical protein
MVLLQAAAQHLPPGLPPINITVQQPAGGMPEWEKTLISAGVGAIAAILSALLVDSVKKRQLKKTVHNQLNDELMDNMAKIESAQSIIKNEEIDQMADSSSSSSRIVLRGLKADRYEFYFSSEKALLYQLDKDRWLSKFYEAFDLFKSGYDLKGNWHIFDLKQVLSMMRFSGQKYIEVHKLKYKRVPSPLEEMMTKRKDTPADTGESEQLPNL